MLFSVFSASFCLARMFCRLLFNCLFSIFVSILPIVLEDEGAWREERGRVDIATLRFEKFGTDGFFTWPGCGGGVVFLAPLDAPVG